MERMFPDGDYGKHYINMIYSYANMGSQYAKLESTDKAIENMKKAVSIAEKFDSIDRETPQIHTSPIDMGLVHYKGKTPGLRKESECENLLSYFTTDASFSSLRNLPGFMSIIEKLNNKETL